MVEKSQVLNVRNTGKKPAHLRFKEVLKSDGSFCVCQPWLTIKPDKAIIQTGKDEDVMISLFLVLPHLHAYIQLCTSLPSLETDHTLLSHTRKLSRIGPNTNS